MDPKHDKPVYTNPYSSLVYLKHYVGYEGIGIFLVRIGLQENPYDGESKSPYFDILAEHLKKNLRDLVDVRSNSLIDKLSISEEIIKNILENENGVKNHMIKNVGVNSSLGDSIYWILQQTKIEPKHFDENSSRSMQERKIVICKQIGAFSLEDILPRANQFKPRDLRTQYDYLRGYLPKHFNQKP